VETVRALGPDEVHCADTQDAAEAREQAAGVNAVVDALSHLGVRHIDVPIMPEKVWRAMQHPVA
jgi:carbon-monoxide dehydrogenase large subunit